MGTLPCFRRKQPLRQPGGWHPTRRNDLFLPKPSWRQAQSRRFRRNRSWLFCRQPGLEIRPARRLHSHLQAAQKLGIVIYIWDAEEDALGILAEHPGAPFVRHSFTGTAATAQSAVEKGGYVSFSGVITFKTSQEMRNLANQLARERILIETDAPYLAPAPFHDRRNVPSLLPAHRGNPRQSAAGEPE